MAYLRAPLPHCAILIDRHIQKNGGTSMRAILLENDYLDGWQYWGYGLNRMPQVAAAIVAALSSAGNTSGACNRMRRSPLRLAAELHYNNGLPGLAGSLLQHFGPGSPLQRLVASSAAGCLCKVVLVTRLREPVAFYNSFWRWTGMDRKQMANASKYGLPTEWASSFRNMQSTLLWDGVNAAIAPQYLAVRSRTAAASYGAFWCFDEPATLRRARIPRRVQLQCGETGGMVSRHLICW